MASSSVNTQVGKPQATHEHSGEIGGDGIRFKREVMGFPAIELVAKRAR